MGNFSRVQLLSILILLLLTPFRQSNAQGVVFDDSDSGVLRLSNAVYELGLSAENGAILYLFDKNENSHTTLGSNNECLWGVYETQFTLYEGGCLFEANGSKRFEYEWLPEVNQLVLTYRSSVQDDYVAAEVRLTASDSSWLDLALQIENGWNTPIEYILFPSDLLFESARIEEGILPLLPGVGLNEGFFEDNRTYVASYPAPLFADYTAVSLDTTNLTLYSIANPDKIQPVHIGFIFNGGAPASTVLHHTFEDHVESGSQWQSPTVRLHVGESFVETAVAYRENNQLDQTPSLSEKLGNQYHNVVSAPLLKADMWQLESQLNVTFESYKTEVFPHLPTPALFHPVTFWDGAFDDQYPDLLPTNPSLGTVAELADLFQDAQERGMLVMPYTNPTWWDDEAETTQSLSQTVGIERFAALNRQDEPIYEVYNGKGGYVVSPTSPEVQNALEQSVAEMLNILPSDLLFEDQIGARPPKLDFNAFSEHPTDYVLGWLAHTKKFAAETSLMTEGGYDALLETEAGFHSSILLSQRLGATDDWWGDDQWRPLPIATLMGRDKTLFYQHNLAPQTMTTDEATLSWNSGMGYMLSYDLFDSMFGGGLTDPWLDIVSHFQKEVLAQYAGERVVDFRNIAANVTETTFETTAVITNWHHEPYEVGDSTISPNGMLIQNKNGDFQAGLFSIFAGKSLAEPTYIIQNNEFNALTLWHSSPAEIIFELPLPEGWSEEDSFVLQKLDALGQVVSEAPIRLLDGVLRYTHAGLNSLANVDQYRILNRSIFLQTFYPIAFNQKTFAPDLVVDSLLVGGDTVQLTIVNQGDRPTESGFWVDLYIDPDVAPTAVNQTWDQLGDHGLVWGVSESIPVNGRLTLTLNDAYYAPAQSNPIHIEGGTPIYLQVDSFALGATYGAVLETHEIDGQETNNIIFVTSQQSYNSAYANWAHPSMDNFTPLPSRYVKIKKFLEKESTQI